MQTTISRTEIVIHERLRKDYGDVSELAENLADVGLIQPVVLQYNAELQKYILVAGGRRMAALDLLGVVTFEHGVTSTPGTYGFVFREELPADKAREIELYENLFRKAMTWPEHVLAVAEIHALKSKLAALDGEEWTQVETGRMLGVKRAMVGYVLTIADAVRAGDKDILAQDNMHNAMKVLMDRQRKQLTNEILKRAAERAPALATPPPPPVAGAPILPKGPALAIPLSSMLHQGKMEEVLMAMKPGLVDHIVTDWPYAINMANLQQANVGMDVSSVAREHGVEENLTDFPKWMAAMHYTLKDSGFCVIFCDQDHWHYQKKLAESVGFSVQRWPLTWVKTHPCMNGAAQYNFTKTTEIAMVCRKGNATLQKQQPTSHWLGDNLAARKRYEHPFAKPEGLFTWIYEAIALKGHTVLDPFAGRGSAVIPAIKYGLLPIAIEVSDEHYPHLANQIRTEYISLTGNNVTFA